MVRAAGFPTGGSAVKKSRVPTLFIHGDEDAMISVDMSKELYEAAACEKELLIVEGAGHGQSQDKDPDTYYRNIEVFLEKNLQNCNDYGKLTNRDI